MKTQTSNLRFFFPLGLPDNPFKRRDHLFFPLILCNNNISLYHLATTKSAADYHSQDTGKDIT